LTGDGCLSCLRPAISPANCCGLVNLSAGCRPAFSRLPLFRFSPRGVPGRDPELLPAFRCSSAGVAVFPHNASCMFCRGTDCDKDSLLGLDTSGERNDSAGVLAVAVRGVPSESFGTPENAEALRLNWGGISRGTFVSRTGRSCLLRRLSVVGRSDCLLSSCRGGSAR